MSTGSPGIPVQDSEGAAFDPWLLWVTLRRCWHWSIPLGLVLACLAGLAVLKSFVPEYRAMHLVEANSDFILYKGVMPTVDDLAKTERPILFNHLVLDPVLSDPGLRLAPSLSDPENAENSLRSKLAVVPAGSRSRMMVSYTDTDREYAAKVCNAVVSSYLRQRAETDQERVSNLESLLIPEIDQWKREVENQKTKVSELSKRLLGYVPGQTLSSQDNDNRLSRLDDLRSRIGDLEVDIVLEEAKLELMREENARVNEEEVAFPEEVIEYKDLPFEMIERGTVDKRAVKELVAQDEKVVQALGKYARADRQMIKMEELGTAQLYQSDYREWRQKRDAAKAEADAAKLTAEKRIRAELEEALDEDYQRRLKFAETENDRRAKLFDERKELQREMLVLQGKSQRSQAERTLTALIAEKKRQRDLLQEQYDSERAMQEKFQGNTAALQFAQDDLERATDLLNKLQDRAAQIRTERRQLTAVRTLAYATPPSAPVEDLPYKKLLAVSGAAFVIPFLAGLLLENKNQSGDRQRDTRPILRNRSGRR